MPNPWGLKVLDLGSGYATLFFYLRVVICVLLGQACMDVVVNPPRAGEPSYNTWKAEVDATLDSLKK
jgi:hypothetical protein